MRQIGERTLSVVIGLLALRIRKLDREGQALESRPTPLSDRALDDLQECPQTLEHHEGMLDDMREQYEAALADGVQLPACERIAA